MGTSSARPEDLEAFARANRAADDEIRGSLARLRAVYAEFQGGNRWGSLDAASLLSAVGNYLILNDLDARWVARIAEAFRAAGGDGDLSRLPDAALAASLRAAGLTEGRQSLTFDDPVAYGFPPTSGFADDPVNTASGNFLLARTDLPHWRRVYNSRAGTGGAFGPGWSCWADVRLRAVESGALYAGPDGQRALFPRQGSGYGRVAGVGAEVVPDGDGLRLRWFDGRQWTFDTAGRPERADHLTFGHHEGRLTTVTARGGRTTTLTWADDRIVTATSPGGRRIAYAYTDGVLTAAGDHRYELDERGRVAAVTDADGVAQARNTYDDEGRVSAQTSRFGRRTRYAYLPGRVTVTGDDDFAGVTNTYVHDQLGRLLSVTDGHGKTLSRTYDEWGSPVTVTDRKGAVSTQRWTPEGRLLRRTEPGGEAFEHRYDDAGRVLEVSAGGASVRYRYDGDERTPSEVTDAEGGTTRLVVRDGLVHEVTDPDGVRLIFGFDGAGDLISTTDALGNTARIERDADGQVTATVTPGGRRTLFRYDGNGHLTEREDPTGRTWRYAYSPAGRLLSVTDPAGARSDLRYGDHGDAEATVDPLGQVTTRRYDDAGNLARLIAADGTKWDFAYDALSRLTAATDPAGATWLREYDAEGAAVGSVDPAGVRRGVTVDRNGRVTGLDDGLTGSEFTYDELGRAVTHRRPDGTAAHATYDRCGRRTSTTDPLGGVTRVEHTPGGRVRRVVSPGGRATTFEYDAAGRRTAIVDGAGRRTSLRYDADGLLVARDHPGGRTEALTHDDAGRLTGRGPIRFGHDAAGRINRVTDATGAVRHFEYDPAGRLVAAIDPLGGRTTYEYHPRGWPSAVVDPLGGRTTRAYDEVGRVVAETDPLGRTTTMEYDRAGRLITRTDGAGRTLRWTHDVSGRVVTVTAGDGSVVTFRRDALGRPVAIDEPGFRHRMTWDRAGRLVERERNGLTLRRRWGPDGEHAGLTHPDGSGTVRRHDDAGLLTDLAHPATGPITLRRDAVGRVVAAASPVAVATWDYADDGLRAYTFETGGRRRFARITRDRAGRITAVRTEDGERQIRYDDAGQVISSGPDHFAYDGAGRLVRDGAVALDHDAAGQLRTRGDVRYEYDGSGRRVRDGDRTFEWDAFGRLAAVVRAGRRTPVKVDITGELAEVAGRAVLWDGGRHGRVCWFGDEPVTGPGLPWSAEGRTLAPDWQGTAGGSRDVWGAPARDEPGFGFRGELEFAGLTWLRNRAYDPSSRSFLSPDPLPAVAGTAWSGNPYHYAGNDPLGRADPLGLRPITDAELTAYRDEMGSGAFEDAADWVGDNWEYLAAGAMVVGGVALMFTGVGGPAGIALMAASGGLISAGASAGIQKFTTGEVDWGQVAKDGLIGAAAGGLGAGTVAAVSSSARLAATNPLVRELAINGAESVVSGGVERGLTGGDFLNPRAMAADLISGGAVPAPGGKVGGGPDPDELVPVWRFHDANDPETLRSNLSRESVVTQQIYQRAFEMDPKLVAEMAVEHADGNKLHSPFVSVTTDVNKAANTTDPWLHSIINGGGAHPHMHAPNLSYFEVPRSKLVDPDYALSQAEEEKLFFETDTLLEQYRVSTVDNPFHNTYGA